MSACKPRNAWEEGVWIDFRWRMIMLWIMKWYRNEEELKLFPIQRWGSLSTFVSRDPRAPPENQFSARLNKLSSNPRDKIRQWKWINRFFPLLFLPPGNPAWFGTKVIYASNYRSLFYNQLISTRVRELPSKYKLLSVSFHQATRYILGGRHKLVDITVKWIRQNFRRWFPTNLQTTPWF